jgi:multimeric flavodoxin WrbA
MRILGLSCGRKLGNSELLLLEALMAANELGVDVELIRMHDLNIKPCKGCISCIKSYFKEGPPGKCVIDDDDVSFFGDRLLDSDGIIIAAPSYTGSPPGYFRMLSDRMGPPYDLAWQIRARNLGNKYVDTRFFKPRVAGTISVGGAMDCDCQPVLYLLQNSFINSMMIPLVDHFTAIDASEARQVLLHDDSMQNARTLGINIAKSLGKEPSQVKYLGKDPGTCPVCHENVMVVWKELPHVICPQCRVKGVIKAKGTDIEIVFDENDVLNSKRSSIEARTGHLTEVREMNNAFDRGKEEIQRKFEKYKSFKFYSKPPKK